MRWESSRPLAARLSRRPGRAARSRRVLLGLALVSLGAGAGLLGGQGWLQVKAQLAERLIAGAYADFLADGQRHPPWRWADMWPIARLEVPRLSVERHVLSGCSGSSMAFGIGHIDGTAQPNDPGDCILAGHRDSWCRFLRRLQTGDEVRLRDHRGCCTYRVRIIEVVAVREGWLPQCSAAPRLVLVTCYPFDGLMQSPWRYVVLCEPDDSTARGASPSAASGRIAASADGSPGRPPSRSRSRS